MEKLSLVNDNTPLQNHAEFHHSHLLSLSSTPAASQAEDAANVEMLPLTAKRPSVQFPPRGAPWGFACLSWRKWTNHCAHTDCGDGGRVAMDLGCEGGEEDSCQLGTAGGEALAPRESSEDCQKWWLPSTVPRG